MALGIRKLRLNYEKMNMWFPDHVSFSMIRGLALARLPFPWIFQKWGCSLTG